MQTGLGRLSSLCDCGRQSDRGWEGGLGPVLQSKGLGFSFKANGCMGPSQLSASLSLLPPPSLIHSIASIGLHLFSFPFLFKNCVKRERAWASRAHYIRECSFGWTLVEGCPRPRDERRTTVRADACSFAIMKTFLRRLRHVG